MNNDEEAYEDFGRKFDNSFPACAFFTFFFFLKWDQLPHMIFFFLGKDQSTVAHRAETSVAECFLTSCVWARFHDRFPHNAWTA